MAFFAQPSLTPLLQLLNDYESTPQETQEYYKPRRNNTKSSRGCPKLQAPPAPRSFMPAFDVRELTDAYYLDGELPGVDQSQIEIEFTDAHTLVIKGHTERNYNNEDNATPSSSRSSSPAGWHQPTVEDEDAESTTGSSAGSVDTAASGQAQAEKDEPHYWAAERSTGDFQRTFSFTARVDQDNVRASLKNGILSVVVPKEATPTPKKIRIL
ncbi:HSP20-like chaperone [Penicillium bovifimosum]|uniref:HSP20-like chaperone n=1 Tax=Penicillium bovifimosum TaxID=126998 RepID=A0A9W9GUH8_9EURO|nr:HSP20-like chaperone [Penicillium bovifimosum]KAJ5130156.1 HSP20-like chaperone [Penicillium bovifimosum]